MANKSVNYSFDPFKDKRTNFDAISTEINSKTTMQEMEKIIEEKRKDIFDILSTSRADWNTDDDEKSLKKMKDALDIKKTALEEHLWEVTADFDISSDNTNLVDFCNNILNPKDPAKEDKALGDKCWELLEKLQNVYTKWSRKEKLFSGKKDPADGTFEDLTNPDCFNNIFNSKDSKELQKNIDEFVNKVYNSKDNSFSISKTKLYWKKQAEVAARTAIFLHCMQRALNEWKISDTKKVSSILKKLENEQIQKIRWIYNLKKEKEAVDSEYETLVDIRKNDISDIDWTDTTTNIDLTDSFESKSIGKAKKIDFYNLNKDNIKIIIGSTTYPSSDIILKDASWEKSEFNTQTNFSSWDYTLCLKILWSEVEIWKLCIDYSNPSKASFVLKADPNITTNLNSLGVTWDVNVEIPIMAVKNVATPRTRTGQVSLTRKIKATVTWTIVPPPPPFTLEAQREFQTTITNVDQVNRAIAQREADEELRERYKKVWWNIFDRANLFLRRKFIKDRIVNKKMSWKSWIDWSESGQAAAHRHQIEKQENLADNLNSLVDIDADNYPETRAKLDTLVDDFTWKNSTPPWTWWMSESNFQTQFSYILKQSGISFDKTRPASATIPDWKPVSEIIKSNNLKSLSTNILMQAKQFQAHQKMVYNIREHILANPTEWDDVFDNWCRGEIGNYISTYDDIPDFLHQMKLSLDNVDDIKTLKWHDAALATIQVQSLKYRLQILDGGSEAYNVKKWWWVLTKIWRFLDDPTGWEHTKFGRWMNQHPGLKEAFWWIRWGAKVAAMVTPWLLLAPLGPLAVASWVGGMSAITTLVKKKSHYEKENRSYQRMQATNLADYRTKRDNLANEVAWMKWYEGRFWWPKKRIRDQYRDYVLTTQDQLSSTSKLLTDIKAYFNKWTVLTNMEKDDLGRLLADWLARLDYHKETGQNFLWSDSPAASEKEYKQLQNAILWWTLRLKIDTNNLRNDLPYVAHYTATKDLIEKWTGDEYNTQWYLKARKRFKRRSNTKAWVWALKAWAISFGLSYLASSLASGNRTNVRETYTNNHSWRVWWEYNLWDMQEHLFASWDVNPTMSTYINWSTSQITWCQLYSSVDSVRCSAAKGAAELAAAHADLSSALSNPVVAWNHDLVAAVHHYVTDATTRIWMIPWLDAGNHDLVLARAIEWVKEWILEPIITSWNTSIVVNPTWLTRVNWWIQQSSVGAVGQSFRNMWIMWLDYVQKWVEQTVEHVTRAIPIPVWLNTFWAPKSDPE